jgi:hypothetical protein
VKDRLRDPSSFEHIDTVISPVDDGDHKVVMTYRANNGFGGKTAERAEARVYCLATTLERLDGRGKSQPCPELVDSQHLQGDRYKHSK